LYGLLITDNLLNSFQFNTSDKFNLINQLKINYSIEFLANKTTITQLKEKYREFSKDIKTTLNKENLNFNLLYESIKEYSKNINSDVERIISLSKNKKLEVDIKELIGSLLHMQTNRLFIYNQRVYEFVLYDFLVQYYKSELAKSEIK
jgi:thiopeptide-type bacteriocin biosynthesis protein